ncbi:nuclear transport factor 2 family protein [Amycolatopsis sp. OK19-0408]|uniref:Nuclear transport factor 2 family protein n=1 Tax=Amycolatopsis iheyensis TaxID=2945988 RepID=A0A9X2SJ68_9PSEU|nr:nuclear transport factor 2 family protein [Amycolatopsis iheyensis]MCR6482531.1 nuclear transport factor 2 family protein [Amycolatopsis iheyensis]
MSNVDVIRAHYAASDRGDLPGMLAPLGPKTTWTEAAGFPYAGTYTGPDEVRSNVFEAIGRDWDGYTFTLADLLDAGDTVVGVGTYTGTHHGTGKSFTARVAHLWRFEDGHVLSFEQIVDSAPVVAATREQS